MGLAASDPKILCVCHNGHLEVVKVNHTIDSDGDLVIIRVYRCSACGKRIKSGEFLGIGGEYE